MISNRVALIAAGLACTAAGAVLPSAAAAAAPAIAPPTTVACGTTVTHSITLATDIDCPSGFSGTALTVAAGNLTIDLNGHTITVPQGAAATGIVDDGYAQVNVRDGSVDNFLPGLELTNAGANHLQELNIDGGGQVAMVSITRSAGVLVSDSQLTNNFGDAIDVTDSPNNSIVDSTADGGLGEGVALKSANDVLRHDSSYGEAGSLYVSGSNNQLVDQTSDGLVIGSGDGNLVRGGAYGGHFNDGIDIDAPATNTTIESVHADNSNFGIVVDSASTQLIDNVADDNLSAGIDAVPGVTGRGNEASGNHAQQCVNIHCS